MDNNKGIMQYDDDRQGFDYLTPFVLLDYQDLECRLPSPFIAYLLTIVYDRFLIYIFKLCIFSLPNLSRCNFHTGLDLITDMGG